MRKVCIVGLGYVGLPLACLCARNGYKVTGIDLSEDIVNKTNLGISHIKDDFLENELTQFRGIIKATTDGSFELSHADIVVVCVPTPVDSKFRPILDYLESAAEKISSHLRTGQLIVLESTVHPGTTEEIFRPILEKSGLKAGIDFYLAYCPERIDPGNEKWNVSNIPRVVGAVSSPGAEMARNFYSSIINAEIITLKSPKEAEATKVMENSFRDINIAFINELARSFDHAGIDIMEVIKGASTKPFAFLPHYPGCGVGGHCIPVDPYYLIEKAKQFGFDHKFLELARKINKSMPNHSVYLLSEELNKLGKCVNSANIGVYGVAYKKDVDDSRESPTHSIVKSLKEKGANVIIYDPYIKQYNTVQDLTEFLSQSDYLFLVTNHSEILNLNLEELKNNNIQLVFDGRNCLNKEKIKEMGVSYKGIGC
jgi:UDP-N-acetyl-D-glucosamine dehydrogenase